MISSLKQPKPLYLLFFTEMWERFSYYGMRSILILYMTQVLLLGDSPSYLVYGTFTAFVYMTTVLGGFLADRCLGFVKAVSIGAVFIVCGHISLSLPFISGTFLGGKLFFYLGLSLIIVGTGFFKANVSTIVGTLYKKNDPRRDGGFTIFYMGINLGALLATLSIPIVAHIFGWHYGFSLAAFGMTSGLIVFLYANKSGYFPKSAYRANLALLKNKFAGISLNSFIYMGAFIAILLCVLILSHPKSSQTILIIFGFITLLYLIYEIIRNPKEDRAGIFLIIILSFISMFFWSAFEQAGSSITLFTQRNVSRSLNLFGHSLTVPTGMFQALNAFFIIATAPFISRLWQKLSIKKMEPSVGTKFSLGMFLLAIGFACLAYGAYSATTGHLSSMIWVVLSYFFQTIGELSLSPIGLSAVTRYGPLRLTGMLMGTWFMASAFANYIAGLMGKLTSMKSGETYSNVAEKYYSLFFDITVISLSVGIVVFIAAPWLKKLSLIAASSKSHNDDSDDDTSITKPETLQ